jgi:hypothetical protein
MIDANTGSIIHSFQSRAQTLVHLGQDKKKEAKK